MSNLTVNINPNGNTPKGQTQGQGKKTTANRDALRMNEIQVQEMWEHEKVFEADAADVGTDKEKFIVTFPSPYSNGHLHIGHAFSSTKSVFRAQFERHMGKNVLFPFAFHCTGMPIQAAANKLKAEIDSFGNPPKFPEEDPEVCAKIEAELVAAAAAKQYPDRKAKGRKMKLVSKFGIGIIRQWNILAKMIPAEEIHRFIDPLHWLNYFPPIAADHMKKIGSGVDWRRSFITTSLNPYYDAFIRWQFNVLREKGKILFGKRNNVYSIVDGQVCADHDRSEGEGVGPQEYVLIKLKVLEPNHMQERHEKMKKVLFKYGKKGVYLVPATRHPETMYGQTNCFVLPTGEYGAYYIDATDEVFIMSARSARGLSCQLYDGDTYFTKEFGRIECLERFSGDELLGLPVKAPNATYEKVYILPLLSISIDKGTGVMTSVPSDTPDDYMALKTLKDKPDFAAKYGITPDMVDSFEVVPIIEIEGIGDTSAVFICNKLKIKSANDKAKLAQAKEIIYLKGFRNGIIKVGPYAGQKVSDAKPKIKQEMIEAGQAHLYFEPESRVISRTNDDCVVAATDQWYLAYGEESWTNAVKKHILDGEKFNAYEPNAREKYEYTTGWLKEWACTRQFGLGTFLPWDKKWVIESLSDSTIYMAYYTISHILQGKDNLNGDASMSPGGIDPADLTDDVFNYIYRKAPMPENSNIKSEILEQCKTEFRYWYPMDLRVSAKDLIPNHLTMALYNHAAIWDDEPELWPKGYYTNGHILVDGKKMSKQKGNFLMMDDIVNEFSADATRFACADAGDSIEDGNFSRATADSAIMSLVNEDSWITETYADCGMRIGEDSLNLMDRVLINEVNHAIEQTADSFKRMRFREGLQHGWFRMLLARNEYRSWCHYSGVPMHESAVKKWCESIVVMICPICPHWAEKVYKKIGGHGFAVKAPWPVAEEENKLLSRQSKFLRENLKNFRAMLGKAKKGWKECSILVTDSYPDWKVKILIWMQKKYDDGFPDDFMTQLKERCKSVSDKKLIKLTMQFASFIKKEVEDVGPTVMETALPFDQNAILEESAAYLKTQLEIENMNIIKLDDSERSAGVPDRMKEKVVPGKAYLWFH